MTFLTFLNVCGHKTIFVWAPYADKCSLISVNYCLTILARLSDDQINGSQHSQLSQGSEKGHSNSSFSPVAWTTFVHVSLLSY